MDFQGFTTLELINHFLEKEKKKREKMKKRI